MAPIYTANLIAFQDGKILLVRRSPDHEEGGLWSLPGGTVEVGEDVQAALARESQEELGANVSDIKHCCDYVVESSDKKVIASYFTGTIDTVSKLNTDELSEYAWFAPEAIPLPLAYHQDDIIRNVIEGRSV